MVKLVIRIVAFFVIFGFFLVFLEQCKGSMVDNFLDNIISFSKNTKSKDSNKDKDIANANPEQFNIYVNIQLSEINQQYVACNTTNINISQEINQVYVRLEEYNLQINNENNYINRGSVNRNTLINWVTDNNTFITQLEKDNQQLQNKIKGLKTEIQTLKSEIKSLRKAIEKNNENFQKSISQIKEDIETEKIKYKALQKELNERIEKLSSEIELLSNALESNTQKLEELNKTIKKCIKEIKELNEKINDLIEKNLNTEVNDNEQTTEDINYYYIIDTEDNLKSKGIITSSDLLGGLKINDTDKRYFAILTDKNKTITLGREKDKFEVLSDMPPSSYEFRTINNKNVIIIKDIKAFWSKTKYLVIIKNHNT